tara:strand:- start:265 stop:438 length:174 start_codon:yes stop_codon:yes gene_type:complete
MVAFISIAPRFKSSKSNHKTSDCSFSASDPLMTIVILSFIGTITIKLRKMKILQFYA